MPKMKTRKTLLKRVRISKRGKIMKKHSNIGHLKERSDSSSKSRKKNRNAQIGSGQIKRLKRLLARHGKGIKK